MSRRELLWLLFQYFIPSGIFPILRKFLKRIDKVVELGADIVLIDFSVGPANGGKAIFSSYFFKDSDGFINSVSSGSDKNSSLFDFIFVFS